MGDAVGDSRGGVPTAGLISCALREADMTSKTAEQNSRVANQEGRGGGGTEGTETGPRDTEADTGTTEGRRAETERSGGRRRRRSTTEEVKRLRSERAEARRSAAHGRAAWPRQLHCGWHLCVHLPVSRLVHEPHCAILESAMEMVIREARTVPHTCCIAKSRTSDSGPHPLPRKIVSCAQLSFCRDFIM